MVLHKFDQSREVTKWEYRDGFYHGKVLVPELVGPYEKKLNDDITKAINESQGDVKLSFRGTSHIESTVIGVLESARTLASSKNKRIDFYDVAGQPLEMLDLTRKKGLLNN